VVFVPEFKIKLYVKSIKTVAETREADLCDPQAARAYPIRVKVEGKGDYVFPEDQQKAIETVKRIARKYGLEVEIVDVTREDAVHRILQKKRKRIKNLPTLIASSGERFEGNFTEKQVEELFSRLAEPEWQKKIRTIGSS
jgi:hypothetical protein